jgi:hypothetical protein
VYEVGLQQAIGQRLLEMQVISADLLEKALGIQARIRAAKGVEEVRDILDEASDHARRIRLESFDMVPPTNPNGWKAVH